jgi:outer membrane protein OmpU
MKHILLATTALALSATLAAAEIKFSGDARLGLQYSSNPGAGASKTMLEKRMTVDVDGTTTSDNGVTFGARVRIRSDETTGTQVSGARVFAQVGGLTVAGGNIEGAIEFMPNLYGPAVGLTGLDWDGLVTNVTTAAGVSRAFDWDSFDSNGNGAEGIEVIYAMGDFSVHASHSADSLRGIAGGGNKRTAIHGAYTFGEWTVALGFQDSNVAAGDAEDKVVLTVGGKIGDFAVTFGAAQNGKNATKITKYAISGAYTMGATTINGYVANQNVTPVGGSKTSYGLGLSYALGGGASIQGGIERTATKTTRADLGVAFNF